MTPALLIRFGELGTKGRNRGYFERRLMGNVRKVLDRIGSFRVTRGEGRLFVWPAADAPVDRALEELRSVFGISSFSPALVVDAHFEEISKAALESMHGALTGPEILMRPAPVHTFKVETRRADKSFPMPSLEVCRELGARMLDRWSQLKVDVHHPELTVSVDIRSGQAWVYTRRIPGPGGLPARTAGRVCLLLSGGIDSPVAGWMMLRRGARMDAVFMESPPYTSRRSREKVFSIARVLSRWHAAPIRVWVVPFTPVQEAIMSSTDERLRVVLYRRFMARIARHLADRHGALTLVTGDSLGQVASQTLENITAVDDAVDITVLRPLIGMDKQEIISIAERIGTFDTSVQPHPDCCSLFLPRSPRTRVKVVEARRAEEALAVEDLVARAVEGAQAIPVSWDEDEVPGSDEDDDAPEPDEPEGSCRAPGGPLEHRPG